MTFFCDILEGLPFNVVNLKCENSSNPVGIDLTNPRLAGTLKRAKETGFNQPIRFW